MTRLNSQITFKNNLLDEGMQTMIMYRDYLILNYYQL
jgi:hypothetical protein